MKQVLLNPSGVLIPLLSQIWDPIYSVLPVNKIRFIHNANRFQISLKWLPSVCLQSCVLQLKLDDCRHSKREAC